MMREKMKILKWTTLLASILLVSCKATDLAVDEGKSNERLPTAAAKPLSQSAFNDLTPEQQYQVANRLSGALYKGVPFSEFFDIGASSQNYQPKKGEGFLIKMRKQLKAPLDNRADYNGMIELRHGLNDVRKPAGLPLAQIREYPISRDSFEAWMAYTLANTILFSPAEEIVSATYIDMQRIYSGLIKGMREDVSMRDIIFAHMKSQANWRRFRSPEDNTREMMEIYLGLFDRDKDVPKASLACQNWSLKDGDGNYELEINELTANTEPQYVLGQWATSCEDFYKVVAEHSLVIPRMVTFIVDNFFPNFSSEKRTSIVKDIVSINPQYFHDIFLAILFSEEFLLHNQKPKSFEETFFNLAERVHWVNDRRFLNELTNRGSFTPTLHKMNQPAMSLKLGRFKDQPLDSLSFAFYHTAVREYLLTRLEGRWGLWGSEFVREGDFFDDDAYVDFLFMSVLARKSTPNELITLKAVFVETENQENRTDQARIVFDYISRLPELYYDNAIVRGE